MSSKNTLNNPLLLSFLTNLGKKASPGFARFLLKSFQSLRNVARPWDGNQQCLIANLKKVFHDEKSIQEIQQIASECLYLRSWVLYDLYHYNDNMPALRKRIHLTPQAEEFVAYCQKSTGAIAVSSHFVSSDVIGMELAQRINNVQVISVPDPDRSYQQENKMRENFGIRVTPASMKALQQVSETLRQGGLVATGVDRAYPDEPHEMNFFGSPALLPTFYIRLALRYNVPIFHFSGTRLLSGEYILNAQGPIWPERSESIQNDITINMQKIITLTEKEIQAHPEQWGMFHPVWKEQIIKEELQNGKKRKKR